jgi:lysophospholipase L1-like esterase
MDATTPAPRESWWIDWHNSFMARKSQGPIDLLFIGDSITQAWAEEGKKTWDREYAPRNAANFGIGGDETQHVLWRLTHGELDGLAPKLVVLMIGTNNLGNAGHSAAETAAGVSKVIDTITAKLPTSKLLALGIFPRDQYAGTPHRRAIAEINRAIEARADGRRVWYLDLGPVYLRPDGSIDAATMPDYLHLSPAAYQAWADAMRPTVEKLMDGASAGD